MRGSGPILFLTILLVLLICTYLYLSRRHFFVHAHTIIMEALSCFLCRLICPALKTNHDVGEGEGEAPDVGEGEAPLQGMGCGDSDGPGSGAGAIMAYQSLIMGCLSSIIFSKA